MLTPSLLYGLYALDKFLTPEQSKIITNSLKWYLWQLV